MVFGYIGKKIICTFIFFYFSSSLPHWSSLFHRLMVYLFAFWEQLLCHSVRRLIRFLRFHLWLLHLAIQILLCVFQERHSLYLTGQPPHPLMLQALECLLSQSWKLSSSLQSVALLKPWLTPTEGGKGLFGLNCYITVCPGGQSQQEPGDRSWSQCLRGGLLTGFLCTAYSAWFFIQVNTSYRGVGPPTSIINSEYAPQTCLQPIQWQQFLKWSWFESS